MINGIEIRAYNPEFFETAMVYIERISSPNPAKLKKGYVYSVMEQFGRGTVRTDVLDERLILRGIRRDIQELIIDKAQPTMGVERIA
jgi:hypothetical protein